MFELTCALFAAGALCEALGKVLASSLYFVGTLLLLLGVVIRATDPGQPVPTTRRPLPYSKFPGGGWWFRDGRKGR